MEKAREINPELVVSHSLEELASALKEQLFREIDPFSRPIVIVPNHAQKRFLQESFAEDPACGIAAGVEIVALPKALHELLLIAEPSLIELTLRIEAELVGLLNEKSNEQSLAPLLNYLQNEEHLPGLSEELARLFLRYGQVGDDFLNEWQKENGWQQLLWKRVFAQNSFLPLSFALKHAQPTRRPLYIYNFSTLPKPVTYYFKQCHARYFLFSPSPLFWGDLCTDRERVFLRKKAHEKEKALLDKLLDEQNPLLANLAKVGRDFQNRFLDEGYTADERYAECEATTLLQKIRADLYENRKPQEKPLADLSIQIHAPIDRLREVEILYSTLQEIMESSAIVPREILVLAPDISLYFPYIQAVFGAGESLIDFSVHDLPRSQHSALVQGLQRILEFGESQFATQAFLPLLAMKEFKLSRDAALYRKWIEEANIQRGHDSWEKGFERLLLGLAMQANEETAALPIVEKNSMEKLGELIECYGSLKRDLSPILEGKKLPISEWLKTIQAILTRYFECGEELSLLKELIDLSKRCRSTEEPLSFRNLYKVLKNQLFPKRSHSVHTSLLDAVHFANLQDGAVTPARVICLLGMEEGAFPRLERNHSLSAITPHEKYLPSQTDLDRFLFLQILFAARDYFILSYPCLSPEDGKALLPSLLIQELLSYVQGDLLKKQTPLPTDPANFLSKNYGQALSFLAAQNAGKKARPFFEDVTLALPEKLATEYQLSDLRKLAKNPFQFYCNKSLDLYLPWDGEENEFSLSSLAKFNLLKDAWTRPLSSLLSTAKARGDLPNGVFGTLAERKLQEEFDEIKTLLPQEIFEVEWKQGCKEKEEWKKGHWIAPPLKIEESLIVGKLSGVSVEGLLFPGKDPFAALPDLLLYALFLEKSSVNLILLKEQKTLTVDLGDPNVHLLNFLKYSELAAQYPSPFYPEWSEILLEGTAEEFQKKVASWQASDSRDPYRTFLFAREKELFPAWATLLRALLKNIFN